MKQRRNEYYQIPDQCQMLKGLIDLEEMTCLYLTVIYC